MTKFKLKKHTVTYKGNMYNPGDCIEMDSFDDRLPRGWFEEIIEKTESKEIKETTRNRKKSAITEEVELHGTN